MIYGYLRVSTDDQDIHSQKQGVEAFAKEKGWEIDTYISDEGVSGGKDPDKRNLGPLLKSLKKGDIVIAAEISRLGRDLYMVMDILHYCMEMECVIYTVKDRFVLGNDIQSKVLAFAFGLAAEIERQMIRQRTAEGLRLRMKNGVLLGRPPLSLSAEPISDLSDKKEQIIEQFKWGVPERRLAQNFCVDRNTITRWLHRWGVKKSKHIEREDNAPRQTSYKDGAFEIVKDIDRDKIIRLIETDLIIPHIALQFPEYSYEQIYDTIYCDVELNKLYRRHGQKVLVGKKKLKE